jgi:predicted secreted hydrolase
MHSKTLNPDPKPLIPILAALFVFLAFCAGCDIEKRPLQFPFDHGPHFNAVNEWWYFTGDVKTAQGKTLGFEFTIFKRLISAEKGFAFLGHLAVSDPDTKQHAFVEKTTSPPVTGIEEGKTEITIKEFSYRFSESSGILLKAETEHLALDLTLSPVLDVLPHGEDGLITMGDGRHSYYYSFTNLATTGTLSVNGTDYTISGGRTWMDHQWGNYTILGMKWDWFSLRLDDGGSLMLFQFRDILDSPTLKNWSFQSASGEVLYGGDFSAQAARRYTEEQGRSIYPVDWTIAVPELDAEFQVSPLFDAQSLHDVMTPDYWEGLCSVAGTMAGKEVTGSAYVELTGYEKILRPGSAGSTLP